MDNLWGYSSIEAAQKEIEDFRWALLLLAAGSRRETQEKLEPSLLHWAIQGSAETAESVLKSLTARSMESLVSELVGHRLMRVLQIPTAPDVRIVGRSELSSYRKDEWLVKGVTGLRRMTLMRMEVALNALSSPAFLVVKKIPRAIPVSLVRSFYHITSEPWRIEPMEDVSAFQWDDLVKEIGGGDAVRGVATACDNITKIMFFGKPELPEAPISFYSDFRPSLLDWPTIREATKWDSDQALVIHAARFFLACSSAHASNLLVDPEGKLYVIDFEFCTLTDGSEIELLFNSVKHGTRAFRALAGVAQLTEKQVAELFEDLPRVAWPLGSEAKTAEHYCERLRLWKRLYAGA